VNEPSPESLEAFERAAHLVLRWALEHHGTLPSQPIGLTATPARMQSLLHEPPTESGRPFEEILARFAEQVAPFAFRVNHPRFLAFVPGTPALPSIIGDWLAAAANFFCGVWFEASGPSQIELTVLDWFRSWLGCPPTARGLLTSGGSEANLIALVVARERIPFADRDRIVLYVSEQRHWSIDRAAKIIGLRSDQVRPLRTGSDLKLHAAELSTAVRIDRSAGRLPWAVVATAGATNSGAVDPLEQLTACCRAEGLWLHVDAAYGWAAVLTDEGRRELAGIGESDSITLDPHKWLAQAFEAGGLLVKDGKLLEQTFSHRPDYLQDATPNADEINFADHGIALTRRFRALKIWVSVQALGLGWFRELVKRCCSLADYAQRLFENAHDFQVLNPRQLSVICFRCLQSGMNEVELDALNERVARELLATGRAYLSSTRLHGKFALRMCFVNWRTTESDVLEIVELLRELARKDGRTRTAEQRA
jgi:glutamate/tyrosine decarboxylase-like PLP-dependent enzyme